MDAKQEAQIERQIEKVKRDLAALGDLRPGSLSTQYNVCGSPGCRCKATPPEKHGPYYQISFSRKGKSSTKFVRKEDLPAIRKQLKNYENMKMLVDRWIDLATELSNLRLKRDRT
ncbi:MAG: DUF6788 family protein [Acidobacteriaceae bacterium]